MWGVNGKLHIPYLVAWKELKAFPSFEVSNTGVIREASSQEVIQPRCEELDGDLYLCVELHPGILVSVAKLVYVTFVNTKWNPPYQHLVIEFRDRNMLNCSSINLIGYDRRFQFDLGRPFTADETITVSFTDEFLNDPRNKPWIEKRIQAEKYRKRKKIA